MGNLHCRQNFSQGMTNEIFHNSPKEHLKNTKMAKFGCEMLVKASRMHFPLLNERQIFKISTGRTTKNYEYSCTMRFKKFR